MIFEGDQPIYILQVALISPTNEIKTSAWTHLHWGCLCLVCFLQARSVGGGGKS